MMVPLDVRDLVVSANDGRELLRVARFEAPSGALIGVQGPSGAGKSTFLFALAGLLQRVSGAVRWGETDLTSLSNADRTAFRADQIGFIFQDFLLFEELSAADNAALGAMFRPVAQARLIQDAAPGVLATLGLTDSNRRVDSFSGGERQRVAIARALAPDPPILLADEPTASLQRPAADRLAADLCQLARDGGKTMIVVSHDDGVLARMDRVVTIRDGVMEG